MEKIYNKYKMLRGRNRKIRLNFMIIVFFSIALLGCKKSTFLDANPNKSFIVPNTIADFQAMLDYYLTMNSAVVALLEYGGDDYYSTADRLNSMNDAYYRNLYVWDDNNTQPMLMNQWSESYRRILDANLAGDGLDKIGFNEQNRTEWENAKGSALFLRAFHMFNLVQVFCPAYDKQNAEYQPGLPLRLTSEADEKIKRSSNKETFQQVLNDLETAVQMLPITSKIKTRPSKHACYALLARVYLVMQNYELALKYANLSLSTNSTLLDYNNITTFERYNAEVIWNGLMQENNALPISFSSYSSVDSNLVTQYAAYDRRILLFFADHSLQGKYFIGSYDSSFGVVFAGLATDEIYLIKAECEARLGNKDNALTALNALIVKRFDRSGSWSPYTAGSSTQALQIILAERRKELVMRGIRFSDLKRLNKEGANITLERVLEGKRYLLPPNDKRYTYLIPASVIGFNPGMPQNER